MCNQNQTGIVELTIPANTSMLLVVRLTTAGVLARAPIGVDRLDDAKMAVEEACHCMMNRADTAGRIGLEFRQVRNRMYICVRCSDGDCGLDVTDDPQESEVIRNILESLVDEAEIRISENQIREIRMCMTLENREAGHVQST